MQERLRSETNDIHEQLMALSKQALISGHYEAAYHALTVAMHCASDLNNEEYLVKVEQEAKAQRDWIDSRAPEHRMSTQSASKHQGKNLYDILMRQITAQISISKQKHRRNNERQLPWLGDRAERFSREKT